MKMIRSTCVAVSIAGCFALPASGARLRVNFTPEPLIQRNFSPRPLGEVVGQSFCFIECSRESCSRECASGQACYSSCSGGQAFCVCG
jgi:hypothetical protein